MRCMVLLDASSDDDALLVSTFHQAGPISGVRASADVGGVLRVVRSRYNVYWFTHTKIYCWQVTGEVFISKVPLVCTSCTMQILT